MKLQTVGYYLAEIVGKPNWINLTCSDILSVSNCICNLHPLLSEFFWQNLPDSLGKDYCKKLLLTEQSFQALKEDTEQLFDEKLLDVDSRFVHLSEAVDMYQKYFVELKQVRILSIATQEENYQKLLEDGFLQNAGTSDGQHTNSNWLGCDILGWDICGFHSYLCNGLEKILCEEPGFRTNKVGLLQVEYQQAAAYAKRIEGKGEPVDWMPFAVFEHCL